MRPILGRMIKHSTHQPTQNRYINMTSTAHGIMDAINLLVAELNTVNNILVTIAILKAIDSLIKFYNDISCHPIAIFGKNGAYYIGDKVQ